MVTWPWKVKLVTPIRLKCNISKTTWAIETSNLVCSFVWGMPSGRTKIPPKSGRGLSHVTPNIFGTWSNISPKLLELETSSSNLVHGFVWSTELVWYGEWQACAHEKFPKTGRGLGHVTPTIFGSTVGYPSDSFLLLKTIFWHGSTETWNNRWYNVDSIIAVTLRYIYLSYANKGCRHANYVHVSPAVGVTNQGHSCFHEKINTRLKVVEMRVVLMWWYVDSVSGPM